MSGNYGRYPDHDYGSYLERDEHPCPTCGSDMDWRECERCTGGYVGHDCGEDTCCCADPEDNVVCDICEGEEGWYVCYRCTPDAERAP